MPGPDQTLSHCKTFKQTICFTWVLLFSLSLPHLTFQGFVDMSLVPNLSNTHVSFNSSFPPKQSRRQRLSSKCTAGVRTGEWKREGGWANTRMHHWIDHSYGQLVAGAHRTFWGSYEIHLAIYPLVPVGHGLKEVWLAVQCYMRFKVL